MRIEREAKLLAAPDLELPDLAGVVPGIVPAAPVRRDLDAAYHDSDDLALARSGVTLRHRTGESGQPWTVKLPAGRSDSALARGELGFDGPAGAVPTAAQDLVLAYLRSRPLNRTVRLRTDRTAVELCDRSGTPVVEVVDDRVTAYDGERRTAEFREVEVELLGDPPGGSDLLRAVVDRLLAAGCRAEPPVPKLVRALGDAAAEPPDLATPEIGPDPTIAELLRYAIAKSAVRLVRHDAGVRLGEEPEDVHQFRVATRRLRSDLRTFGTALEPGRIEPLRAELRWLAGEIGGVRDNDVLRERLRGQLAGLPDPPPDAGSVSLLFGRLTEQGEHARMALLRAMRGERYVALLDSLVETARRPPFAEPVARRPAAGLVGDLVRRQWRRLSHAVRHLGEHPPDSALHEVRILAKRCRYAAEAAVPGYGNPAAKFAEAVADVQTVLGDHQDAIVAEEWLRTTRATIRDGRFARLAARLIDVQRAEAERLRATWPEVWRTASAQRLREWLPADGRVSRP